MWFIGLSKFRLHLYAVDLDICFIYPYTKKFKDRGEIKRPLDGQYYCLELIFRKSYFLDGSLLWNILFCSWVRTIKHVEWYWCGLCDHWFDPVFNLLAPELFFFLILAHSVYKMWIIQEPNTLELWNKLHFERKKNGQYTPCLKYSVPIFVESIYKMQLWSLAVRYVNYSWH